jgi:hypothetical protein
MFGKRTEVDRLIADRYELLEQAAHYLQRAKESPSNPAGYADLAARLAALAIQAGVPVAEVEARLLPSRDDQEALASIRAHNTPEEN